MPKGLEGDKRPADVNGAAVPVSCIGTGDTEEKAGNALAKGREAGGPPAKSETSARRTEIDKASATPRWEG